MDDYDMEESVSTDRLSELPNSIIHHIFSFLRLYDAVSTTLLSKRWHNLWTTAPCLNICDVITEDYDEESIRKYYNRALLFWKGANILKFSIHLDVRSLAVDINLWVRFAVVNDVEELKINLTYDGDAWEDPVVESASEDVYRVPQSLNSCSSIRQLSLVGCNLRIQEPPLWNRLTSLKIDGFCLGEWLVSQILLGCSQLEVFELRLLESNENLTIRSTSLKVLKIEKYLFFADEGEPSPDTVLRIFCANLETLEISGVLYCNCLFANVSSLADATIGFCRRGYYGASWNESLGVTLRQIFSTIKHVEKIALSSWCIKVMHLELSYQVLVTMQEKDLFSNVKSLRLNKVGIAGVCGMMNLLWVFPNLKILIFEDLSTQEPRSSFKNYLESRKNYFKHVSLKLKTIVITSRYLFDPSILWIVEFLLKHVRTLEKFVLLNKGRPHISLKRGWCLLDEVQKLLKMPRASPTAQVIYNTEVTEQEKYCYFCGI